MVVKSKLVFGPISHWEKQPVKLQCGQRVPMTLRGDLLTS
jgi:hypothetical protein